MHRSRIVNFVSAGMLSPKKRDHILARRQLYLNYGALSLATKLQLAGYDVSLVHGEHRAPEEVFRQLEETCQFPSIYPLMISIPSFYALPWAQEFCKLAKTYDPNCRIVVGGRWVVGPDIDWLRAKLPEADVLAPGLSEGVIERLLTESPILSRVPEPTPRFTLNHRLVEGFAEAMLRQGLDISWRTETRCDVMTPQTLEHLARAGLRVIDLGLETASPRQILAMKKAGDPGRYLAAASDLLAACRDNGVKAKVNVLLYAGETRETLEETTAWLDDRRDAVAGVSVGPVLAYGPPKTANVLIEEWFSLGARPIDENAAAASGITGIHLSPDFPAEEAEAASLALSKYFMDQDAYFALKSFSYYPRDYGQEDFNCDVAASDPALLPFTVNNTAGFRAAQV